MERTSVDRGYLRGLCADMAGQYADTPGGRPVRTLGETGTGDARGRGDRAALSQVG